MATVADEVWMCFERAAEYTTLSVRTLRKLAAAGRLNVRRPVPGRAVLSRTELDALLADKPSTWVAEPQADGAADCGDR